MATISKSEASNTVVKDFLLDRAFRDANAETETEVQAAPIRRRRRKRQVVQPKRKAYTRLTPEKKDQVLNELLAGNTAKDVAVKYGISMSTADNMRREYRRLTTFARIWKENSRPHTLEEATLHFTQKEGTIVQKDGVA